MYDRKFAVIGAGVMGQHHVRVYKSMYCLVGIFDVDRNRAEFIGQKYDTKVYSSITQLLDDKPDGVSVVVPTPFHFPVAEQCLRGGANILVEKPISGSLIEARQLVKAAETAGKILGVGYIERFNPVFKRLKMMISSVGDITSVNIRRTGGEPRSADNVIIDLMTHDIDLLLVLFGRKPEAVWTHKNTSGNIINSAQTLFDFGTASATCEANWISPKKTRTIHITGTRGYLEADLIEQEIYKFANGAMKLVDPGYATYKVEPLSAELRAFRYACENKWSNSFRQLCSGADAVRTLEVTLWAAQRLT